MMDHIESDAQNRQGLCAWKIVALLRAAFCAVANLKMKTHEVSATSNVFVLSLWGSLAGDSKSAVLWHVFLPLVALFRFSLLFVLRLS